MTSAIGMLLQVTLSPELVSSAHDCKQLLLHFFVMRLTSNFPATYKQLSSNFHETTMRLPCHMSLTTKWLLSDNHWLLRCYKVITKIKSSDNLTSTKQLLGHLMLNLPPPHSGSPHEHYPYLLGSSILTLCPQPSVGVLQQESGTLVWFP